MKHNNIPIGVRTGRMIARGIAVGVIAELAGMVAASFSVGAGHGDYAAARILFPLPMLTTIVEGKIGVLSFGLALLQFPLYGAIAGWSAARTNHLTLLALGTLHVIAALACFSGTIPDFS